MENAERNTQTISLLFTSRQSHMPTFPWAPLYQQLRDQDKESPSSESLPWLFVTVVGVTLAFQLLEAYLAYRDVVYLKQNPELPSELKTVFAAIDKKDAQQMDQEQSKPCKSKLSRYETFFLQSCAYTRENHFVALSTISALAKFSMAMLGRQPYMWDYACFLGDRLAHWNERDHPIIISVIFAAMANALHAQKIVNLLYGIVYLPVEEKYGLNRDKATRWSLITDSIKNDLSSLVLLGPQLALLSLAVQTVGDYFFIGLWMVWCYFSMVYTSKPSTDELQPLSDGILRATILALAERVNYPVGDVLVSSKYVSPSKVSLPAIKSIPHVLLHDSLLKEFTDEEIVALIGQALGHWKLSYEINWPQVDLGFGFLWFCRGRRDVFAAFGFNNSDRPIPDVLVISVLYGILLTPISTILDYCMNALFRKRVFAVDKFVATLGLSGALQTAMCKLQLSRSLEVPIRISPISNSLTNNRPSLTKRFKALKAMEQQRKFE